MMYLHHWLPIEPRFEKVVRVKISEIKNKKIGGPEQMLKHTKNEAKVTAAGEIGGSLRVSAVPIVTLQIDMSCGSACDAVLEHNDVQPGVSAEFYPYASIEASARAKVGGTCDFTKGKCEMADDNCGAVGVRAFAGWAPPKIEGPKLNLKELIGAAVCAVSTGAEAKISEAKAWQKCFPKTADMTMDIVAMINKGCEPPAEEPKDAIADCSQESDSGSKAACLIAAKPDEKVCKQLVKHCFGKKATCGEGLGCDGADICAA